MNKQPHIKRIASFLMILVMVFTITPKRTVHEILGCHDKTSVPYHPAKGKETGFNKDRFHCACENQEFQHSFTEGLSPRLNVPFRNIAVSSATPFISNLLVNDIPSARLRGPPVFA